MKLKLSLLLKKGFFATLLLGFCYGASDHHAHWSYSGESGPKMWGELDPSYSACKMEKFQSPINILDSKTTKSSANFILKNAYTVNSKDIVNNGHTIQVNFNPGNSLVFDGVSYDLVQLHFHTPSENQLNNRSFPAEVHMVHKDSSGNLLVVGVFIKQGNTNLALQSILKAAPNKPNTKIDFKDISLSSLLPQNIAYYQFQGSLTTPPCSGNVTWVVMRDSIDASKSQIHALNEIMKDNARDVQPLNGRTISISY
ncbi:carbonic anhydrase family protein [Helicobacter muridarum]|uniref:Carbonic anhydrase n=1 Tax=Helicobacter muridarum TaxID=216 RepID=A0A377PWA0_9HELI|nr:carbonic anhydrase family protein [Helicobacter muridarum]TLD99564.1 carbonic anhydrase family protein [Helicobacter muridarum]STQ85903.1 carbonic anhydrase [Helicobacter muridarum]